MKIILDTNVFISGVFFDKGYPRQILEALRDRLVKLCVSPEIINEYEEILSDLSKKYPKTEAQDFLRLILILAEMCNAPKFVQSVCKDIDDDIFLECAIASKTKVIVSGDKLLLETSGYKGIKVVKPRDFVESYLQKP